MQSGGASRESRKCKSASALRFNIAYVRLRLATRALVGVALAAIPLLTARRVRSSRNGVSSPAMAVKQTGAAHNLPDKDTCVAILERMLLIRRFEERAGEMYAKAKIGGFLHLCIGEEATIVGAVNALRDEDYLMSTYREHGQAIARGTHPNNVMAELFGRVDGVSKGRGGSMHLFDL